MEKFGDTVHHLTTGSLCEISMETMDRIEENSVAIPIERATGIASDLNLVYALYGE